MKIDDALGPVEIKGDGLGVYKYLECRGGVGAPQVAGVTALMFL